MRRVSSSIILALSAVAVCASPAARAQKADSTARPEGILDVAVVDESGERLRGATVDLPGYRSTTGLSGTCRFGLIAGRYPVRVSKPGYRTRGLNVVVHAGKTRTVRVQLTKLPSTHTPRT